MHPGCLICNTFVRFDLWDPLPLQEQLGDLIPLLRTSALLEVHCVPLKKGAPTGHPYEKAKSAQLTHITV